MPPKQSVENPSYSGSQELQDLEMWMPRYCKYIVKRMAGPVGNIGQSGVVVEFGAGNGFLMQIFHELTGDEVCGVEIDADLSKQIKSRGFRCEGSILDLNNSIKYVYTSNVLEHIEDDQAALFEISSKLQTGGKIGVYVPALPLLYSGLDSKIGHFRRYKKHELRYKLERAGFEVELCEYVDSLGILAALLTKILGYKGRPHLGSSNSLKLYDKFIFPFSRFIDALGFRKIAGKNLVAIARKV
jgi:hypothetical protein